ncbi:adenine phosphoribosyltransferase [Bosea caraganae]|uniref:Adenine phosphoribosyltransferase n=1 Tax=Bosea caraganae TaxID=2763117 RepID=A0A370L4P6_9HYPH|nr:phosphoribosyltransferase family protein [Bosea caraganae]RDJ24064.1 adenine phosphoribosyltransferase [Bosea caraganae]RDJ30106.1 adenine phosphoribosyltransferase [Bosea caraganae]
MNRVTFLAPGSGGDLRIPYRRWKDHPVAGADFPDIGAGTIDGRTTQKIVSALAQRLPDHVEVLAGIDIGGLGLAGALAYRNGLGFIEIRKVDSIRVDVIRSVMANYELGSGVVVSKASRFEGRSVAILDDVLMSGGTAAAAVQLIRRLGAKCVTALFVFELAGMAGRERLEREGVAVHVLEALPQTGPDRLD